MLSESNATRAAALGELLAHLGDMDSTSAIRETIQHWRYGEPDPIAKLTESLYRLEGQACAEFLADLLLGSSPPLQYRLLNGAIWKLRSEPAIVTAATKLMARPTTPELSGILEKIVEGVKQRRRPGETGRHTSEPGEPLIRAWSPDA